MKIAYAFRRSTVYPYEAGDRWLLMPEPALTNLLTKVKEIGFDGIESVSYTHLTLPTSDLV